MPIYSPTGFLDVTNATLRGSKIVTTSNVGIANLDPLNTLSVGSNLQVEDTGSNVLTIHGNAAMTAVTLGAVHVAPVYDLEVVTNLGNTVSNTVQFTNDTTGFVSTANIEIGTNNLFVDTTTGEVTVGNKLDVSDAHASNLTVASALYANAATGRVGVHTTNPGNFALDVHGSANVGALTATDVTVTGNLAVAGELTSIRSTTVTVDDPIIGLANNNTTGVLDVGFVMQRPNANVAIVFDESSDTLEIGYTQGKHTDTTITMDDSSLFHTNIHGNVSVSNLEIGQFSVVAAYGLDHVTNENNSTGDTIISTHGTTGLQTTANVDVGRDALVSGNVVVSRDLTVDTSTFHVDSSTNRVGVLTTSPGYDLDVHGSANVGTLTTGNLEVGTANLFVDTTTGNVGIGMTDPGHNLDIVSEMNLRSVSNTASIKYNSNVVTEFVRSKKLIKYPRVAMTSTNQDGYVISFSTADTNSSRTQYGAFDGIFDNSAGQGWQSLTRYSTSTGLPTGDADNATFTVAGTNYKGQWLKLQLPQKIQVESIVIAANRGGGVDDRRPHEGVFLGSNDNTNWELIKLFDIDTSGYVDFQSGADSRATISDITSTSHYEYIMFVITKIATTNQYGPVQINEIEYYGIPEYDPEAHGTDVIARSVPNVPNTDWLEVYYDAKGLSDGSISTVDDLTPGGSNDGTATNLTVSDEAFVFNGTSDIRSTVSTFTGDQPHTMSVWVNISTSHTLSDGYICVLAPSTGENLDQVSTIRFQNDGFNLQSWGNDIQMYNLGIEKGRWYHLVVVYAGGGVTTSSKRLYIDAVQNTRISGTTVTSNVLNFSNTTLSLGSRVDGIGSHLTGSIANFRLFNRALSPDEIWQLYAYQKDYFQVSPDVVTFKGGRLGIGTLEPKAPLDVMGIPYGPGARPVFFATNDSSSGILITSTGIFTDELPDAHINAGNCYDGTTGRFTPKIAGIYMFTFHLTVATDRNNRNFCQTTFYLNGTNVNGATTGRGLGYLVHQAVSHNDGELLPVHINRALYLNVGDYVQVGILQLSHADVVAGQNYSWFTGYLLS